MKAIELSRKFFEQHARDVLARECPQLLSQMAIGVFGLGSDVLGLDDELSRDHHWGPRMNILAPAAALDETKRILGPVIAQFPRSFEGFEIAFDSVLGIGVSVESLPGFLERFIGLPHVPRSDVEWLNVPAADMLHVVGGQVFHDEAGIFTAVRQQMHYFPDNVWKRRIAHNCRAYSGFAVYVLHRAIKRNDAPLAAMSLGQAVQTALELVFLLNRQYFPYKKWLYPMFLKLPRLAREIDPLLQRITSTDVEAFDAISDVLNNDLQAQGLIAPGRTFTGSETSGYRLLERAYGELLRALPREIAMTYPEQEQKYWELNAVEWFLTVPWEEMEHALNLQ